MSNCRYLFALGLLLSGMAYSRESLTLLAEDDWFPYAAQRNGQAVGMAVDIVREAYRAVDVSVSFRSMPYARCMKLVEVGREIGCFDSLKDATTEPDFRFGKTPLFHGTIAIYGRSTAAAALPVAGLTVAQLSGKRVGLTNGYTYGSEVELDHNMVKDIAASDLASLRKLLLGRLDYALVYSHVADYLQASHRYELAGKVQRVGEVCDEPLYLAFSKRHARSARAMQQLETGLRRLHDSGRYQQIIQSWDARF